MELIKARNNGKGFVLFGSINGDISQWFERWFVTEAKAQIYAEKRGWVIKKGNLK